MWRQFGAKFKSHPQMTAKFPSGAEVQFKYCLSDKDVNNFDGGQFSFVCFDEAQWHSEVQIKYLESRIRSKAKAPHQLICTANPSRTSYLYQFVQPYLDMETGIPRKEMFAVERWYATMEGKTHTAATKEELVSLFGDRCKPQTYTYIAATIADNPIMKQLNPSYVDRLENLKKSERDRLYLGSWHVTDDGATYWKPEWCEIVEHPPVNPVATVRAYDLAAGERTESYCPDWTVGVKMSRDKLGTYYIEDVVRFQKRPDGVLKEIVSTAYRDGLDNVTVAIPIDAGSSGKVAAQFYAKILAEDGVYVRTIPPNPHKSKLTRFKPFTVLCENGNVKIVKGDWNEEFINELKYFDGERSKVGKWDDQVDATSDAFMLLARQRAVPEFVIPNLTQASPVPSI